MVLFCKRDDVIVVGRGNVRGIEGRRGERKQSEYSCSSQVHGRNILSLKGAWGAIVSRNFRKIMIDDILATNKNRLKEEVNNAVLHTKA